MKPFEFKLQKVLRLREWSRDLRSQELLRYNELMQQLQEKLTELETELQGVEQSRSNEQSQTEVDVDRLLSRRRYSYVVQLEIQQVLQAMRELVGEQERARQALVEADREVRVLDKLRENQSDAHALESERQATRQLDEIAVQRQFRLKGRTP